MSEPPGAGRKLAQRWPGIVNLDSSYNISGLMSYVIRKSRQIYVPPL